MNCIELYSMESSKLQRTIVVAIDEKTNAIGNKNNLIYTSKRDLRHFTTTTSNAPHSTINIVVMGKKTWNSIPEGKRPLKNRINIVFSHTPIESTYTVSDLQTYLQLEQRILNEHPIHKIFIIGGGKIYDLFFESNLVNECFCTYIRNQKIVTYDTCFNVRNLHEFQNAITIDKWNEDSLEFTIKHYS